MIHRTEKNPDSTITAEVGFGFWGGVWGVGKKTCEYTIFKRRVCALEIAYSVSTPATDTYLRCRGYCILGSADIKADFINVPQPCSLHKSGYFNTRHFN